MTIASSFSGTAPLDDEEKTFSQNDRVPYQIHNTYLVSPIKSGFLLIDQQAAHERILYERFLQTWMDDQPVIQRALFPETIHLTPTDSAVLDGMMEDIAALGYQLKKSGEFEYLVEGVPADLAEKNAQSIIERLLEQYKSNYELQLDTRENLARSLARSAAIKRGTALDNSEMRELIDRLFACAVPYKSPNGRQCFVTFDMGDLERMFN